MPLPKIYVVEGFKISSFVVKPDKIRIVLEASKDDIKAQDGNLADIIASMEAHASGEFPVEMTVGRCDAFDAK
jgi:hypothetical protein